METLPISGRHEIVNPCSEAELGPCLEPCALTYKGKSPLPIQRVRPAWPGKGQGRRVPETCEEALMHKVGGACMGIREITERLSESDPRKLTFSLACYVAKPSICTEKPSH